jgi:uncharacterized repeat protein (TIGR03803 family)
MFLRLQVIAWSLSLCIVTSSIAQSKMWGVARGGGANANGVIFSTDNSGLNYNIEYHIPATAPGSGGIFNGGMTKAPNGKVYGITESRMMQIIFEFDPATNTSSKKYTFPTMVDPVGKLLLGANGKLWGMTNRGGINGHGSIYEFDYTTQSYTTRFSFGTISHPAADPLGSLTQGSNGKIYGLTRHELFEFDPANNTCIALYDFYIAGYPLQGRWVYGEVTEVNGKLYGLTNSGGVNDIGVIFEFDLATKAFAKKFDFQSSIGSKPFGSLVLGTNQKLYGTTSEGGASNRGVLFSFDPATAVFQKIYDFAGGPDGRYPTGNLTLMSNGKLYGATQLGGANDTGTIFELDPTTNVVTKKYEFTAPTNAGTGTDPLGTMVLGANGLLYGYTGWNSNVPFVGSGAADFGVIFEFNPTSNVYSKKLDFGYGPNGSFFWAGVNQEEVNNELIQYTNGKFYGTMPTGGSNSMGTLFELDPTTKVFTKKVDFNGTNGKNPEGALVVGATGKMYGITRSGGANNSGVIFEYNPTGNVFTKKVDINAAWGSATIGLVTSWNGKIYGITDNSIYQSVVLFEYDPVANTLINKLDLLTTPSGPLGRVKSLVLGANGNLFGIAGVQGYAGSNATLFEYNIATNTITIRGSLNAAANYPCSLIQSVNGKLYGATSSNGSQNHNGHFFEYDPATTTLAIKFTFTQNAEHMQFSYLAENQNGKIYGLRASGFTEFIGGIIYYYSGVIYEYDPVSANFVLKQKLLYPDGFGAVRSLMMQRPDVYVTTPASFAANQNVTLNVTAKAVTGASTYTTEINTSPTFNGTSIVKSGTATQSFSGLAYSTQYYARVKTNLNSDYGLVTTFSTPASEYFAWVSSPASGSVNNNVNLTVTSNTVVGATNYTIELSTTPDFSGTTVTKSGAASQTFNDLAFSTTYFTRVKTNLSPNWGVVKSFTTGSEIFLSYVSSPANNATNQLWSLNVTLNKLTGATSYTVQLSPTSDFSAGIVEQTSGSTTMYFSRLAFDTKYYSRVTSNLTPGVWGASRNFTTGNPVTRSYITAPANGSTTTSASVNVTCNSVIDATTYTVELSTLPDFPDTPITQSGSSNTMNFILEYGTTYFARVKTDLAAGWGPTRSFTTGTAISNSYVVTPSNGAVNQLPTLNVTANLIYGASLYTIQLSPVNDFSTGMMEKSGASRTLSFGPLKYNTIYYTRATTDLSPGQWGSVRSFTVLDHYMTGPANGGTNVNWVTNIQVNAVSGTSLYTIEANTTSDFSAPSILKTGSSASISFTLQQNTQYFVRAKSNLADGWGSVRSFTTGDAVSLAYVTAPADGSTGASVSPTVSANLLTGATSYTIELNTLPDFTGSGFTKSGIRNQSFSGLTNGTTYYTRVQTSLAPGQWGPTRSFTTVTSSGRGKSSDSEITQEEVIFEPLVVKVFGNPFTTKLSFSVESELQEEAEVRIVDLVGREHYRHVIVTNSIVEIETHFSPGVYHLLVKTKMDHKSARLLKL